jgi:RimJ/RimL family protein N-acetyltransferase
MGTALRHHYYRRTVETLRYEGPHYVFLRALPFCFSPLGSLGLLDFFQKDLTEPLREIRAKVDITVNQAAESDIDQISKLVERRYSNSGTLEWYSKLGVRDTILERFQRGSKCFIAKIGEEIVHYNWIFFHREEVDPGTGLFIYLKDDEALCNDGSTSEAWRGKSIHTAVNNQMLCFLQQKGYRKAYTIVASQHKASKKGLYRVGWAYSGTLFYFVFRRTKKCLKWWIRGTLDPFVGGTDSKN